MKKIHIIALILIAVAIGVMVSSLSSAGSYANFTEAVENEGKDYTVVGMLNKGKEVVYNPKVNPNLVEFYMIDKEGREFKVLLNQSKPVDLEKSEDVVVKGKMKEGIFYANTILLKCPSKYQEKKEIQM